MNAQVKPLPVRVSRPAGLEKNRVKFTCYHALDGIRDLYTVIPHGEDFPIQSMHGGRGRYCALKVSGNGATEWRDDTLPGKSNGVRVGYREMPASVQIIVKTKVAERLAQH